MITLTYRRALSFALISVLTGCFLFPASLSADEFGGWFVNAAEQNSGIREAELEAQLAELEKKKGLIGAENEEQRLTAEITYLTKCAGLRQKRIASFGNIIDAAAAAAAAEIDLRITELQHGIALETKKRSERFFQEGRISAYDTESARIAFEEAETDLLVARMALEEAIRFYSFTSGAEWDSALFEITSLSSFRHAEEAWIENDYNVAVREKELQRELIRKELLSAGAPEVEKRKAGIAVEQTQLAAEAAAFDSRKKYRESVFSLESSRRRVELADRKLELENKKFENARLKFDRGDISAGELDRGRINRLSAEKNRIETVARYLTVLVTAAVSAGTDSTSGLQAVFH